MIRFAVIRAALTRRATRPTERLSVTRRSFLTTFALFASLSLSACYGNIRQNPAVLRVEVVPGITAATGCAAAAGIPLTLRGEAQMLSIVTGHGEQGDPNLDWRDLAQDRRTICVYMGASTADRMAGSLIAHGRDPTTPAAVIVNGTLPQQQVLTGLLRELPTLVRAAGSGPALILIGEVVRQADAWSEPAAPAIPAAAALN